MRPPLRVQDVRNPGGGGGMQSEPGTPQRVGEGGGSWQNAAHRDASGRSLSGSGADFEFADGMMGRRGGGYEVPAGHHGSRHRVRACFFLCTVRKFWRRSGWT